MNIWGHGLFIDAEKRIKPYSVSGGQFGNRYQSFKILSRLIQLTARHLSMEIYMNVP